MYYKRPQTSLLAHHLQIHKTLFSMSYHLRPVFYTTIKKEMLREKAFIMKKKCNVILSGLWTST